MSKTFETMSQKSAIKLAIEKEVTELYPIKDQFRSIAAENKLLRSLLVSKRYDVKQCHSSQELKLLTTVQNETEIHFTSQSKHHMIEDYLSQLLSQLQRNRSIYTARLGLNRDINYRFRSALNRLGVRDVSALLTQQNDAKSDRQHKDCRCPQRKCIAFCRNSFSSVENKQNYSHYSIYSAIDGIGIQSYDSTGSPIRKTIDRKLISTDHTMSIGVEFYQSKGIHFAARVANVAVNTGVQKSNNKSTINVRNLVFHAIISLEGKAFDTGSKPYSHINIDEHLTPLKSVDAGVAMTTIDKYLTEYPVLFKNLASDLKALIKTGFKFDPLGRHRSVNYYDIEGFYTAHTDSGLQPLSLKWMNRHILLNDSQSDPNVPYSPVDDAVNQWRLFKLMSTVLQSDDYSSNIALHERKFITCEAAVECCHWSHSKLIEWLGKMQSNDSKPPKKYLKNRFLY